MFLVVRFPQGVTPMLLISTLIENGSLFGSGTWWLLVMMSSKPSWFICYLRRLMPSRPSAANGARVVGVGIDGR